MQARAFYKAVTVDEAGVLEQLLALLNRLGVPYCVVGGQAVNAYVEPLVSLDLDVVISAQDIERVIVDLPRTAKVERFAHSVNVSVPGSDLRIQVQSDARYQAFLARAAVRDVLGVAMRVAAVEDVLAGKVWAAQDETRRPSKRQKDLADIARLIERYADLRAQVPRTVLDKLV